MRAARIRKRRAGLLGTVLFFGAMAMAGSAFTAANTLENTAAGSGSAAVTGYAVSGVDYVLNTANPKYITTVDFTLTGASVNTPQPDTGKILAKLKSADVTKATYTDCTIDGSWTAATATVPGYADYTCNLVTATATSGLDIAVANELTIIASS